MGIRARSRGNTGDLVQDLLTFNRPLAGAAIQLVYWAGLAVFVLIGFGVVGGAVGMIIKDPGLESILLSVPAIVIGLLVVGALTLVWRAFCEFYVLIINISEDLRKLREVAEASTPAPPRG